MALSDCIKCWDTPCTCGYDYRFWSKKNRIEQAAVILGVSKEEVEKLSIPIDHPRKGEK